MGVFYQPFLLPDLVLDPQKSLGQGLRAGRTAGNIDVDGNDLVYALTDRVGELKKAAAVGAASHRDNVLGIRHLIVEELGALGHLVSQRASDDHQIGLARRGAGHCTESIDIGPGTSRLH